MEEGKFYHIFNRGNNRESIFKAEENYHYFLKQYEKYLSGVVDTYAYCLMPNHFHFLVKIKGVKSIETPSRLTPVEKGFKDFFISYAKSINKRYDRVGSLFQYKFKRKVIEDDKYLRNLVLYIHQNPVEASLCDTPDEWEFSSYASIIGDTPTNIKREDVINWFEDKENFKYCHKAHVELKVNF